MPADKDTVYDDSDVKRRLTDLENKPDNDKQTLALNGRNLSISNGNSVELPTGDIAYDDTALKKRVADLEAKPDNDKQTLSINNRTISISSGNSIELPATTMDGGDNLVCNSAFPTDTTGWGLWEQGQANTNISVATHDFYYNNTQNLFVLKAPSGDEVPAATKRFPVKRNTTYSLNVSMFGTVNIKGVNILYLGRKAGESKAYSKVVTVKNITGAPSTNGLVRYYCTFDTGESDEGFIRVYNGGKSDSAQTSDLYFTELDIYEGTSPRAWQMSPKCLKSMIDAKVDNDRQTLSLNGTNLSISNGNTVQLPKAINVTQRGVGPSTDYVNIGFDAPTDALTVDIDLIKLLKDFKSGKLDTYLEV